MPYIGPQPPAGIHRYVFVAFRQQGAMETVRRRPVERGNFNTRQFSSENDLGLPAAAMREEEGTFRAKIYDLKEKINLSCREHPKMGEMVAQNTMELVKRPVSLSLCFMGFVEELGYDKERARFWHKYGHSLQMASKELVSVKEVYGLLDYVSKLVIKEVEIYVEHFDPINNELVEKNQAQFSNFSDDDPSIDLSFLDELIDVPLEQANHETGNENESNDVEPESDANPQFDSSDCEEFNDSDYEIWEDDLEFDRFVDPEVEFGGLGSTKGKLIEKNLVGNVSDEMYAMIEGEHEEEVNSDDFESLNGSDDDESNPKLGVSEFRDEVCTTLKANISKQQAYRAKLKAMTLIHGSLSDQFSRIREYCLELLRSNPGSIVILKVSDDQSEQVVFFRMYVCFKACKEGFKACRKVVGVDGCFLKGPQGGQLLTVVGVDPNNNIFPLAYAIVENETLDSWE
ncbi:hypothetical protein BUALT_Bualt03G0065600 [Buddleja alternifolia]|uniref:MULE transposase domain-containing protein n=1 Tax=Buddleja alternifolia TaxID=168488 RepID=A0AAV6Y2V2_9LAMI|nr:hypothetical protein BUALT_Bualt03G0065600 [Buddleja alternifolia]